MASAVWGQWLQQRWIRGSFDPNQVPRLSRKAKTLADKVERQLELVGLNGPVPAELADNLNTSKLIRNVWAHNAGKADQQFIDNCPATTVSVGETVTVSKESLGADLVGIVTYAVIIINRFRVNNGMQPFETYPGSAEEPNPFKPAVDQLFPNPVSWSVLQT